MKLLTADIVIVSMTAVAVIEIAPAFKFLNRKGYGINMNGEYITHLRFADDIVIMTESINVIGIMFGGRNRVFQEFKRQLYEGVTFEISSIFRQQVASEKQLGVSFRRNFASRPRSEIQRTRLIHILNSNAVRLRLGVTYEKGVTLGNVTMSHRTRGGPPNALRLSHSTMIGLPRALEN
ncbi:hypothetical protein EVAR_69933_1 [Eumeta japonica]|uniref:Reverse transcriptase domain-containing protein n=1 Tax=Eumeta variegata TaxID=151549 RepID=A0A4C2A863_EUMVA|nr:hypothetical protein EVAR_69933_1 [Eumeta japonica]